MSTNHIYLTDRRRRRISQGEASPLEAHQSGEVSPLEVLQATCARHAVALPGLSVVRTRNERTVRHSAVRKLREWVSGWNARRQALRRQADGHKCSDRIHVSDVAEDISVVSV